MGMGPVSASQAALHKTGWRHQELDPLEINEAGSMGVAIAVAH
jgi:acetyl-CoA acetyltransferase